jgi:hypothetical protein
MTLLIRVQPTRWVFVVRVRLCLAHIMSQDGPIGPFFFLGAIFVYHGLHIP